MIKGPSAAALRLGCCRAAKGRARVGIWVRARAACAQNAPARRAAARAGGPGGGLKGSAGWAGSKGLKALARVGAASKERGGSVLLGPVQHAHTPAARHAAAGGAPREEAMSYQRDGSRGPENPMKRAVRTPHGGGCARERPMGRGQACVRVVVRRAARACARACWKRRRSHVMCGRARVVAKTIDAQDEFVLAQLHRSSSAAEPGPRVAMFHSSIN